MDAKILDEKDLDRFHTRKNPRLKNYDYSSRYYYFVTIGTQNKHCLFGNPDKLNLMGKIASNCLQDIPSHFQGVIIDKYAIMPNHVHAIIILHGNGTVLSTVIGQYKASVTRKSRLLCPDIQVWQASFHDHIIRDQADYERIWLYIEANPARWMDDCFYRPQPDL